MKYLCLVIGILFSTNAVPDNIVYVTEWIDSKEMSSTLNKMNQNRLFPCHSAGKVDGIEIRYKASYCPFLPNMDYFYSRWGMSESWYNRFSEQYKEIGMKEHFNSTFVDLSGNTVYQATWILLIEDT